MKKLIEPTDIYKCLDLEDLPDEEWKDVIGYEGFYQISNMGRVKSLERNIIQWRGGNIYKRKRILIQSFNRDGYLHVKFHKAGKKCNKSVHRLVGQYFVGNKNNYSDINHKKGVKMDNRASELEWCTKSQNTQHAYDTGLKKKLLGEQTGSSKLKENQVKDIRIFIKEGVPLKDIAAKFNVKYCAIWDIKNNKRWTHI